MSQPSTPPSLKTAHEMKSKSLVWHLRPTSVWSHLHWLHDIVAAAFQACPHPPYPTPQMLPVPSPLALFACPSASFWHRTSLTFWGPLPPHPTGRPPCWQLDCSHQPSFQFLASSLSSAASTRPCTAQHEMTHFSHTAVVWPISCDLHVQCSLSWCLCLPRGPFLCLVFQHIFKGFLSQEGVLTMSALGELIFSLLTVYNFHLLSPMCPGTAAVFHWMLLLHDIPWTELRHLKVHTLNPT